MRSACGRPSLCLSPSFRTVPRVSGSILGAAYQGQGEQVMVARVGKGQGRTGVKGLSRKGGGCSGQRRESQVAVLEELIGCSVPQG